MKWYLHCRTVVKIFCDEYAKIVAECLEHIMCSITNWSVFFNIIMQAFSMLFYHHTADCEMKIVQNKKESSMSVAEQDLPSASPFNASHHV